MNCPEFDLSQLMSCLKDSVYLHWPGAKKSSRMTPVLYGWKIWTASVEKKRKTAEYALQLNIDVNA
jgi:hypothetical protein